MKLTLTLQEKTDLLTTALQYFAESLQCWEYSYHHQTLDYQRARIRVSKGGKSICQEDVLASCILHGKGIQIIDENDEMISVFLDRQLFDQNIDKCEPLDIIKILDENGDYDYWTTDAVLQCLFFGEVVYG
jgi:hypothetical protein